MGSDLDGRRYEIIVSASDKAGNGASASTFVVVPHDQRPGATDLEGNLASSQRLGLCGVFIRLPFANT